MNSPFHPMVRRTFNRMVNSWERASDCRHPGALREPAYRAPHVPFELRSHFAFEELRAQARRVTQARDAVVQLITDTSDGVHSAIKAAYRVSNLLNTSASQDVHKNQVSGLMCSERLAKVSCAASFQRTLGII